MSNDSHDNNSPLTARPQSAGPLHGSQRHGAEPQLSKLPGVKLRVSELAIMFLVSAVMSLATALQWWSIGTTETLGFITGGICVWLVVREHLWNWPVGIASNVVFFILFTQSRLYADAGMQLIYLALAVYGWWNWVYGGERRTQLIISRVPWLEAVVLLLLAVPLTIGLRAVLIAVNGAAPFWDALTTVMSLIAQFLLCRKRLEHWYVWMAVDVIYIPLYISRELSLTAVLYSVFLVMCIIGFTQWRRQWLAAQRSGHGPPQDGLSQDQSP